MNLIMELVLMLVVFIVFGAIAMFLATTAMGYWEVTTIKEVIIDSIKHGTAIFVLCIAGMALHKLILVIYSL